MRKEPIVTGEYYHVFDRGVDKRHLFTDEMDHERFVRGMIAFNDFRKIPKELYRLRTRPSKSKHPLVKIMAYALMPNHHHLLIQQLVDNGIATFMQRLGAGYACYFNRKYSRTGRLWESEYKAVLIENEAQLLHVSRYIHLNPLKLFFPNWKISGVPNWETAHANLAAYPWSSYRHFIENSNDSVVDMGVLSRLFRGVNDYKQFMRSFVMGTVGA